MALTLLALAVLCLSGQAGECSLVHPADEEGSCKGRVPWLPLLWQFWQSDRPPSGSTCWPQLCPWRGRWGELAAKGKRGGLGVSRGEPGCFPLQVQSPAVQNPAEEQPSCPGRRAVRWSRGSAATWTPGRGERKGHWEQWEGRWAFCRS